MKTLLKISWRNVWRNKARSIVIILAVGFGLWGGVFATALINGVLNQQFESSIMNDVSHIQIHNPDYIIDRETSMVVSNSAEIIEFLSENDKVAAYSARTRANGMLATASMTSGVELFGIDIEKENNTTSLKSNIVDGDYFESDSRNPILIGERLSEKLNIDVGNRIVITFQDLSNEIVSASFRVNGIYRTSNTSNDERNVFLRQSDIEDLLGEESVVNEIAILLNDVEMSDEVRDNLKSHFPENEIKTWYEISPELSFMTEFSGIAMMILLIIIMFAMAFGILNTMLMTIFERTQELGVLMSIGMSKARVFSMIILETTVLVITGSLFGSIIGSLSVYFSSRSGFNISRFGGDALTDFGFDTVIYPTLDNLFFIHLAVLVLVTSILAAVYPAYKALRLNPAEAVRKE